MKRKINIVLLIIVILILIYLGYLFFTKYAFKREEIEKKENIEEYGPTTVYFEGYYYNMLGNCYGMVSGKENEYVLRIYDNKANWGGVVIIVDKNTFADDSFEDFDKIESGLINRGKNISNKKVTSKGEYNILSFDYNFENKTGILGYMEAYDNYLYQIVIYDGDEKTINYDAFDVVTDILLTRSKEK